MYFCAEENDDAGEKTLFCYVKCQSAMESSEVGVKLM